MQLAITLGILAAALVTLALLFEKKRPTGRYRGTTLVQDAAAFTYRMPAGFAGEVNRSHPFNIEPCLIDVNAPPTEYGQPVVVDATTQGVRPLVAGDSALTAIYGVTVRPFPMAPSTASGVSGAQGLGVATPPTSGLIDILRSGYIMVNQGNFAAAGSLKGGTPVDVWFAANSGNHTQGRFEAAHTGGSSLTLADTKTTWNGPADSNGVAELAFNI